MKIKAKNISIDAQSSEQERKRVFIDVKTGKKDRIEIIKWAAGNNYNTLVFSLREKINPKSAILKLAKRYEFFIEAGGNDLSLLMPRQLFMFNRDLFRMEQGKRKKHFHFCPTNPKTISLIAEQARHLFARCMPAVTVPRIFNLLPDKGQENTWCACPACRAFSPAEQYLIAVNTAADALAKLDPSALLSFYDYGGEPETEGIPPRKNMIRLSM
jgi:hypothetical protein